MSNSPAVQAARKEMQLARLKKKDSKDYPKFYANQPFQVERARQNAEWRAARDTAEAANEALEVASITGKGLEAAKEAAAVANLVAARLKPASRSSGSSVSLSGA